MQGEIRPALRNHRIKAGEIRIVRQPSERIGRHGRARFGTGLFEPGLAWGKICARNSHQHRKVVERSLSLAVGARGRNLGRGAGNFRAARLQKRLLSGFDAAAHGAQGLAGKAQAFLLNIRDAR
ncbi:MAG: hypothetical protein AB7P16_30375, partial [Bradyrhizobium sp.]|uniref:hypothetical protein n=1 Tax=Bradyrhizobium sp. TaxID=376 RepID=UPI003D11C71C